jgi:hypothetical protein
MGGCAVDISHLGFGTDSSYQNTAEFIGATLCLIALAVMGVRPTTLALRGDSVSALAWADTEHFRGKNNTNASFVFIFAAIAMRTTVDETMLLRSEDNKVCDGLSRGESLQWAARELNRHGLRDLGLQSSEAVQQLLFLCDPKAPFGDREEDFLGFWGMLNNCINSLIPPLAPSPVGTL